VTIDADAWDDKGDSVATLRQPIGDFEEWDHVGQGQPWEHDHVDRKVLE
jgi:hypothetical protein